MTQEEVLAFPGYRQPKDEDIAEAQRLMEKAGFGDGFDTLLIIADTLNEGDIAAVLNNQLKRTLNINMTTTQLDRASKQDAHDNGNYDMVTTGSGAGVVSPDQFWGSIIRHSNVTNNFKWDYEGPEGKITDLIEQQSTTPSEAERKAILRVMDEIALTKDTWFIQIFTRTFARMFNADRVGGQMPTQSRYVESKMENIFVIPQ